MDEIAPQIDLSQWLPTYGFLTSQRILERLNLHLSTEELVLALKNHHSLYHQLLTVPLKNVLNGIIFQQAQDYQIYAQKLFIDYLLSGEDQKEESTPGQKTRDDLEEVRQQLVTFGESFRNQELAHQNLISKSQLSLITVAKSLQDQFKDAEKAIGNVLNLKDEENIQKALRFPFIQYEKLSADVLAPSSSLWTTIEDILSIKLTQEQRKAMANILEQMSDPREQINTELLSYTNESEAISIELRNYRLEFHNLIIRATELIQLLPDYRIDKIRDEENRASLHFDAHIGGD